MKARVPQAKPYTNHFAKEAKTTDEKCYWAEAAHFAERLYALSMMAHSYHNGAEFKGVMAGPCGHELLSCAVRFTIAEQCALAIRGARAEEKSGKRKRRK